MISVSPSVLYELLERPAIVPEFPFLVHFLLDGLIL